MRGFPGGRRTTTPRGEMRGIGLPGCARENPEGDTLAVRVIVRRRIKYCLYAAFRTRRPVKSSLPRPRIPSRGRRCCDRQAAGRACSASTSAAPNPSVQDHPEGAESLETFDKDIRSRQRCRSPLTAGISISTGHRLGPRSRPTWRHRWRDFSTILYHDPVGLQAQTPHCSTGRRGVCHR